MWTGFKDLITIYGSGTVNINTASAEVFRALGLDESLVEMITTYRAGPDANEGTEDDGIFEQPSQIAMDLREWTGLTAAQEASLVQAMSQGLLDVTSTAFSLHVQTRVLGKPVATYTIVLDASTGKVKRWTEL